MKSEWKTICVADLGRVVTGKTPKTVMADNYGGLIPFLTPSDDMGVKKVETTAKTLSNRGLAEVKNCLLPARSVCVSCIGSDLGKVVMTTQPTVTNQQINSIIPTEGIDPDFIYYAMTILGKELNYISKTSTAVPIVNKSYFLSCTIKLPSLEKQRVIAATLSALDDKIANNKAINNHLEQMAQAIFKSWFVDFEPRKPFTEVIQVLGGGTPKTGIAEYWNGVIPFFTPKDALTFYVLTTEKTLTESGLNNCNSKLYPTNTVFVTARGTVGKLALAGVPMAMNQSCYALVGQEGFGQYYIYHLALEAVSNLKHKASGAVFDAIVTRDFESEFVPAPPMETILSFEDKVASIYKAILNNCNENIHLADLRDTILPRLMSGELSVIDKEISKMENKQ